VSWSSKMTCQQARMQLEDGNLNSKLQRTLWIANQQGGGYLRLSCPSFTFSLGLDAGCGIIMEKRRKRMSKLCCGVG
jgi:hypothetical protein